jgi:hypothetical protein
LDRNGSPDFSFTGTMPACETDLGFCSYSYVDTALGANALCVYVLSTGDRVGPDSVGWGGQMTMLTYWWSQRDGTSGTNGALATLGEGYLGVRFSSAGGVHYGWVHVRETVVMDWAYETRLGVPIAAGAKPVPVRNRCPKRGRPLRRVSTGKKVSVPNFSLG